MTTYIHLREDTYYFRYRIPKLLKPYIGQTELKVSLETGSEREAAIRSHHWIRIVDCLKQLNLRVSRRGHSSGKPINKSTVARKFQEIGDIVGIRLSTHSMRKTRGYMMHQAGVSTEQIARVLNHSSPSITMSYIGLTREETLKTYDDFEL